MKGFVGLLLALLGCACGRTTHSDTTLAGGLPQAGATSDSSSPGTSTVDADAQPDRLVACPERSDPLAIQLPCLVGPNIAGPIDQPGHHVVECKLLGTGGQDALWFMLPLADVPQLLNEPVQMPLEPTGTAPAGPNPATGPQSLVGTLVGLITFTQVDVDAHAFVATLEQGRVEWGGDPQADFNCSTADGELWAVAGSFTNAP